MYRDKLTSYILFYLGLNEFLKQKLSPLQHLLFEELQEELKLKKRVMQQSKGHKPMENKHPLKKQQNRTEQKKEIIYIYQNCYIDMIDNTRF